MSHKLPKVSIGLPVHNGEEFLCEAIDSILNQDYENIELLISDNASTDATASICKPYRERDPRVIYLRYEEKVDAGSNFNRIPDLATGAYFMWAADDDFWSKNLVSCLVETLMRNPKCVLAYPQCQMVIQNKPSDGWVIEQRLTNHQKYKRTLTKLERVETLALSPGIELWAMLYGLFERSVLLKSRLHENSPVASAELLLIMDIIQYGDPSLCNESIFYKRWHGNNMSEAGNERLAMEPKGISIFGRTPITMNRMSEEIKQIPLLGLSFMERFIVKFELLGLVNMAQIAIMWKAPFLIFKFCSRILRWIRRRNLVFLRIS